MRVFLVGLRRSGTTTLFHTFRQDKRFTCYDEPFNPMLRDLPGGNEWGTHDEFITLFNQNPSKFWEVFRPLSGISEISSELSDCQRTYLKYLLASSDQTFMDFTRMNFKLRELAAIMPDAVVIHLFRSPACFASSHLLPSIWLRRRKLKYLRAKNNFWKTQKKYDFWGIETVIGRHPKSAFGHLLESQGMNASEVYELPAVGRLMAYWKAAYDQVEKDGPELFGENFLSVQFESFCHSPATTMSRIYQRLNVDQPRFDFTHIHAPNPPVFEGHPKWDQLAEQVGIEPARFSVTTD